MGISRDVTRRIAIERHNLDMLSMATHDIRSPLASISSTIKLTAKGLYGIVDESAKVTLEEVYGRIKKLEQIVTDYLHKSSMIFTDVEIPSKEILDLRQDIIDPVLDEFSEEIEEKKILIDNKLGAIPGNRIMVEAHKTWLKLVYRNLISNAIKYGGEGCTIAFGFEDHGDYYRLNVYNSGSSISKEDLERIFEKFESTNGTGLGLPIARDIIHKHDGQMWCENTWDSHPNFIFTLPK